MTGGLPIVFMHYGRSAYLPFTIGRARLLNPTSPVVLIGDETNANYLPFAQHFDMNRFAHQAAAFEKIYRHFSPNGYGYELFCFMRWFVLRDFMRGAGLKEIIHLDSDVLLNVDVNVERENWREFDLTLVRSTCAGNMFVNGTDTLEALCDLIWDMYSGANSESRLQALYEETSQCGGGISDMTALKMLTDQQSARVGEMTGIQPDRSYWDANIHLDEGFEMHNGRKAIHWINGMPYGRHIESRRSILFKSLHYQGPAKDHIEPAFRMAYPEPSRMAA